MRDRLLFVFAALMFCTMPAAAQQTSIVGTATDETKAVLPGVTVTAVELSTGAQFVLVRIGHSLQRPHRGGGVRQAGQQSPEPDGLVGRPFRGAGMRRP